MAETITFQATESNETIIFALNEQSRGPAGAAGASDWSDITGKPSTFTPSAHTHVSADVTDASEGGNLTDDAGKLVKFNAGGGIYCSQLNAYIEEPEAPSITADSVNGTGIVVYGTNGTYYAEFSGTGSNTAYIAVSQGAYVWKRGSFTARIYADAVTANRTYTLGDWSGDIAGVTATQTLTNKTLTAPSMSAPVVTGTARMTMAGVTGAPAATDAITRADGDTRFGAMIVMKVPNDKDITAGSLTDIPDTDIALEANSDYDITGFFGVQTTGGSPTNRVQFRMAYTGTLQTNQGFIGSPNSSGAIFAMVNGAILTTAICDTSNIDRSYPITGSIRTSTAGTLKIQAYRITGGTVNPKLLGGSLLILRKL